MPPKLYTIVSVGLLATILYVITQNVFTSRSKSEVVNFNMKVQNVDQDTFSSEEILYFDTGIGDDEKMYPRLVKYLKSRISIPRNYKPAHEWTRKDYSQFGQSAALEKYLGNKNKGFFIECGAHDAFEASNTAFLEFQKNWTGLLIEGDPRVYPKMLGSRRNTHMLAHCISPQNKPYRANFRIQGGFQGLSDFFRLHKEPDKNTLRETLVTCYPFNAIMDALGIHHIDYFSLDVEGAEYEVLKTIDFKKFRVDLIQIEYAYTPLELKQKESAERLEKFRAFFNATGLYKEVDIFYFGGTKLGLDVVFQRIN